MCLLVAMELELGPAEGLNHMLFILQFSEDGPHDLTNVDPGHCALGLSKGTSHTCLEPMSSSTGQHLVDADEEGGKLHLDVKITFAVTFWCHVLVGTNTGSLQSIRGELLILI